MKLWELFEMISEGTNLRITMDGEFVVAHYDGRNSIDDEFMDCEVNSMWATTITDYTKLPSENREVPYLSIDVAADSFVEIWHTEDGDDWAQVSIDKATGNVTSMMTGNGDYCDTMTYDEAKKILMEDGYTDFDPIDDRYNSYYEYDYCVCADSAYDYLYRHD